MMRTHTLVLIGLASALSVLTGCQKDIAQKETTYKVAMQNGDVVTATQIATEIYSRDTLESSWSDTLIALYFQRGLHRGVVNLAQPKVANNDTDTTNLQFLAVSEMRLGQNAKALEDFKRLRKLKPQDPFVLYQIMVLNFQQENLSRSQELAVKILDMESSKQQAVVVQRQAVPIHAATYNVMGVIMQNSQQKDAAVQYFSQAIREFPRFQLAMNNLQSVDKEAAKQLVAELQQRQQQQQQQQLPGLQQQGQAPPAGQPRQGQPQQGPGPQPSQGQGGGQQQLPGLPSR